MSSQLGQRTDHDHVGRHSLENMQVPASNEFAGFRRQRDRPSRSRLGEHASNRSRCNTFTPTLDRASGVPSTPIEHYTDTVSASRAFAWKVLFAPLEQRNPDPMCSPVACTGTSAANWMVGLVVDGHRSCSVYTMKIFSACGALINNFLSPAAGLGARFLGQPRFASYYTSSEAFASASSQGMQRVGRQAARQCVAAAAHSDSLTMLSLLCPAGWSCGSDHNHGPAGGHWAAGSSFTGRLVLPSRGEATGAAAGASAPARGKRKRPTASVAPQRE